MKRETHTPEYERFDSLMRLLIKVPHSEIKAKLDAEKTEKAKRTKKRGRPLGSTRASGRVLGGKD